MESCARVHCYAQAKLSCSKLSSQQCLHREPVRDPIQHRKLDHRGQRPAGTTGRACPNHRREPCWTKLAPKGYRPWWCMVDRACRAICRPSRERGTTRRGRHSVLPSATGQASRCFLRRNHHQRNQRTERVVPHCQRWFADVACGLRNNDAKSVSTYPNGDILVCGVYSGSGGFAPGFSLPPAEARDVWAARYTAIGTLQWARRLGGSGIDGDDVKCEPSPSGSVIVAFTSDGPVDVGGLSDGGMSSSVVVAELDDSGIGQWLRRTVGAATLRTLAATGDEVAIGMTFSGELGFVALDTATTPGADILVARIAR